MKTELPNSTSNGHNANTVLAAGAPTPKLSTDSKALNSVSESSGLAIGATLDDVGYYMCRICGVKESTRCSLVCADEACKITNKLFIWKVKVWEGEKPPKGTYKGSGMVVGTGKGRNGITWCHWYHYKHSRKSIVEKLQQVRAKLYVLQKLNSIEKIEKALNTNYCNPIKFTINKINYEQQRAIFNTL